MKFNLFLMCILIFNVVWFLCVIFFVVQKMRSVKKIERLMMAHINGIKDKEHDPGVIYDGME